MSPQPRFNGYLQDQRQYQSYPFRMMPTSCPPQMQLGSQTLNQLPAQQFSQYQLQSHNGGSMLATSRGSHNGSSTPMTVQHSPTAAVASSILVSPYSQLYQTATSLLSSHPSLALQNMIVPSPQGASKFAPQQPQVLVIMVPSGPPQGPSQEFRRAIHQSSSHPTSGALPSLHNQLASHQFQYQQIEQATSNIRRHSMQNNISYSSPLVPQTVISASSPLLSQVFQRHQSLVHPLHFSPLPLSPSIDTPTSTIAPALAQAPQLSPAKLPISPTPRVAPYPVAKPAEVQTATMIFECKVCNVTFGRKHDLQRHFLSAHPKTMEEAMANECHLCGKVFSRPDALRRHVKVKCLRGRTE
ncbi:hypothetical protein BCR33DRAFT_711194 [Rhizoclosmatium globosum]|uniref:C2H2-type domain-containing protein n=1 Tax=Rhizoclosmatium globosum TaxID=329046 RepID=A0A1Y2D3J3_9FUNG|nr:hypothetical protein BCR33DRAFT_711194 [Rhizoclosmatium globosum]|eukprot:ORY53852.1 hypothetical protein BCR33DRAFT_711194 [Rhizoclosmatium globosum]